MADLYLNGVYASSSFVLGRYYSANFTLTFDVTNTNGSASSFSIDTAVLQSFPYDPALTTISFQPDGEVLGPFGPFTAGSDATAGLRIQSLNGSVAYTAGPNTTTFYGNDFPIVSCLAWCGAKAEPLTVLQCHNATL